MPNLEWEVPHALVSPEGTLDFNVTAGTSGVGRRYQLQADGYRIAPTLRVTDDNLSQQDGSIPHTRWKTGLTIEMTVHFLMFLGDGPDYEPACEEDMREMYEELLLHLNALTRLSNNDDQRLYWTPTGYGDMRLIDDVLVSVWPTPVREGTETGVTFALNSPFPYGIDNTEVDVVSSGSVAITNDGNANYYPVIEVTASSAFTITNNSVLDDDGNPLKIVFNASLPGGVAVGGGGAEINTFRGTIFAGGSGADLAASIDPTLTDFLYLKPGVNNIVVSGTTATFKTNNAWS